MASPRPYTPRPGISTPRLREQTLKTEVSGDMLRGLPFQCALAGFGELWKNSSNSDGSDCHYRMSVRRNSLHDFISHSWQTSRICKFAALCLYYNMGLAFVTTAFVIVTLAILEVSGYSVPLLRTTRLYIIGKVHYELELKMIGIIVGPPTFLFALFFGHHLPRWMRRCRYVFVDKACIHQTDAVQKAAGIRGLAGYLKKSDYLLILWTPGTFQRLWCNYELVMWLLLGKQLDKIVLLPVSFARATIISFVFLWNVLLAQRFVDAYVSVSGLHVAVIIIMGFGYIPTILKMLDDARKLPPASGNFRMQDAACFCCSVDHRDPTTGRELQCDRALILETLCLMRLGGDTCMDAEDPEATWQYVNTCVRQGVGRVAVSNLGDGAHLPFWIVVIVVAPYLCHAMDVVPALMQIPDPKHFAKSIVCLATLPTVALPLVLCGCMRIATTLLELFRSMAHPFLVRAAIVLAIGTVISCFAAGVMYLQMFGLAVPGICVQLSLLGGMVASLAWLRLYLLAKAKKDLQRAISPPALPVRGQQ